MRRKSGSAIVGAVWILAVLSVLIATYAVDAQLQTRVNLYLQERVRVDHLTDAGIAIAEVILLDYQNVTVPSMQGGNSSTGGGASQSQIEDFVDKDRWYWEKVYLKDNRECDTGAVPVDPLDPDGGTVTVKIKPAESKWNINLLYPQGDSNFAKIWEAILASSGVPEEYWDGIVDSWCDWRDQDDGPTPGEYGAETGDFYKKAYDDFMDGREEDKNKNYLPASRDGEILDLDDLMHIRGFNEFEDEPINAQALLDGGILNPLAKKEDQIEVRGIRKYLSVIGSGKVNVNIADADLISTIPGIFNPEDRLADDLTENDITQAVTYAEAIVQIRSAGGDLRDAVLAGDVDEETGSLTSVSDIKTRLENAGVRTSDIKLENAEPYMSFAPDKFFEVSITGASLGIKHTVKAVAIVQEGKVRYIRWQEDP